MRQASDVQAEWYVTCFEFERLNPAEHPARPDDRRSSRHDAAHRSFRTSGRADMGKLTTHVLDTASGCPAAGVRIELYALPQRTRLGATVTDADGRCAGALLAAHAFVAGEYELVFHIGDYFRARGVRLAEPPFLDSVVLRIGLADADYHVPLLVSPWAYSTYRGS
jgi:5-hydroxyisourate hydrolase